MGPGTTGWGYGPGYGYGCGLGCQQPRRSINESDAERMLRNYISPTPNLQVGSIRDRGDSFEADVITKDRSLVGRLLLDKNTGWIRTFY
jgi:hypothetical protein